MSVKNKTYSLNTTLLVLANPYKSGTKGDVVYTSSTNRAEYVENTLGLIWQGLSDDNTAHTWVSIFTLRASCVKKLTAGFHEFANIHTRACMHRNLISSITKI
jgi:hypothetical protein